MKSYKIASLLCTVLVLASCAEKAGIKGVLKDAPGKQISVCRLEMNSFSVLDTVKTKADGSFAYKVDVRKGQPEFIYLFYGDTRVGAFLLEKGENASIVADTLGHYEISGSEGSVKLAEVDQRYSKFLADMAAADGDPQTAGKLYINHYRECVKYVMQNTKSLTIIPVLYENLTDEYPIFLQSTDAIFFQNALDSLKTVYPESRYVKALEKETAARVRTMAMNTAVANAPENAYPDVTLPNMKGQPVSLSSIESRLVLVHFWDASDAAQKMFNVEALLPIYEEFHSKGLEIYSICLDTDKAEWGSVVTAQKLPWINVCDGKGASCPAVTLYSIASLPTSFFINNGELVTSPESIQSIADLRRVVGRMLK